MRSVLTPDVYVPFFIGAGAIVCIALIVFFIRLGYRRSVRKALHAMIQDKEAIKALIGGIAELRKRLDAPAARDKRAAFESDPESIDRMGLVDLKARAQIIVDELDLMAVPKELRPLAEALADIAFLVEKEVSRIDTGKGGDPLRELEEIDVQELSDALSKTDGYLEQKAAQYGINEIAVYRGGLYV